MRGGFTGAARGAVIKRRRAFPRSLSFQGLGQPPPPKQKRFHCQRVSQKGWLPIGASVRLPPCSPADEADGRRGPRAQRCLPNGLGVLQGRAAGFQWGTWGQANHRQGGLTGASRRVQAVYLAKRRQGMGTTETSGESCATSVIGCTFRWSQAGTPGSAP